jgi:hypothetical protein
MTTGFACHSLALEHALTLTGANAFNLDNGVTCIASAKGRLA